jgi:CHASE3 domain sensor protein
LATFLVFASLSALVVRSWTIASNQRRELRLALDDVGVLQLAYSDQQRGIRGYLLSGDNSFLDPYRLGLLREERAFGRIEARVQAVEGFDAGLADVKEAAEQWQTKAAERAITDRQASSQVDPGLLESGKEEFDRLRAALDSLQKVVESRSTSALHRTDLLQRVATAVVVGGLLSALIGALLAVTLFRRWVTRPLALVSESARAIARSERTMMPVFASVEFQDVADDIDDLQRSLVAERDRAIRAYKCHYANAGHPPGLIVSDGSIEEMASTGPIIGAFRATWTTESRLIPVGGSLIIYSDGLTEARGIGSDRLGEHRVHERLTSSVWSDAPMVVAAVTDLYDSYRVGPQTDDVTLVVLGRMADSNADSGPIPL